MNIEIGASVSTREGAEVGHVHRVVVDLEQQAVVSIVVLKGGLLARDILVPLDFIERADGPMLSLRLTKDQLGHLPDFAYNQVFTPPPTWALPLPYPGGVVYIPVSQRQRMGPGQEDLTPGMRVCARDGDLGVLDRVEVESTGHLDAFWVRRERESGPELRIPVEWVDSLDDMGVHLAATREEVYERLAHESHARRV